MIYIIFIIKRKTVDSENISEKLSLFDIPELKNK